MTISITSTLFYANWCGHCNRFKPEWEKFKDKVNQLGGKVGNKNVQVNEYEDNNLPTEGATINGQNIRGYPTVKISVTSGDKKIEYEYDGKRKAEDLYHHIVNDAMKNL